MATGHDSAVEIKTPIPVHTTYFTAVVDGEGKVKTFGDIYKLDAVVAKALAADIKAVVTAAKAPAPASGDEVEPPHRKPAASGALADSTP
jgi:hypothetical protein